MRFEMIEVGEFVEYEEEEEISSGVIDWNVWCDYEWNL
jgi:hypothetical protein